MHRKRQVQITHKIHCRLDTMCAVDVENVRFELFWNWAFMFDTHIHFQYKHTQKIMRESDIEIICFVCIKDNTHTYMNIMHVYKIHRENI